MKKEIYAAVIKFCSCYLDYKQFSDKNKAINYLMNELKNQSGIAGDYQQYKTLNEFKKIFDSDMTTYFIKII